MEQPPRQSIFKIVSLTKQRPIFLYKVLDPTPTHAEVTGEGAMNSGNSIVGIRRVKEEMQKVAMRLKIQGSTPRVYLEKRSESCDLREKKKGQRQQGEGSGSRGKIQRSIKEYLRLAYKRSEMERRSSYKLPAIAHPSNPEHTQQDCRDGLREMGKSPTEVRGMATMKKMVRRRGFQPAGTRQQGETELSFRPELISGWEDYPAVEQF